MKLCTIHLVVLCASMLPAAMCTVSVHLSKVDVLWNDYKLHFDKQDYDVETELSRKEAFLESLKHVILRNVQHDLGLYDYQSGLNAVSDFTFDEMQCSSSDDSIQDVDEYEDTNLNDDTDQAACMCGSKPCPASVDWVALKKTNPVGTQKCGDCYAWASTFVLASRQSIKHKVPVPDLSVQESKDCTYNITQNHGNFFNKGCSGGNAYILYDGLRLHTKGSVSTNDYPYNTNNGTLTCDTSKIKKPLAKVQSSHFLMGKNVTLPSDDCAIIQQLNNGPLAVSMCVSPDVHSLKKTDSKHPYSNVKCTHECQQKMKQVQETNHAVVLVGYTQDAWLIQNSWGTTWGSGGLAYFARAKSGSPRICNIGYFNAWPEVK